MLYISLTAEKKHVTIIFVARLIVNTVINRTNHQSYQRIKTISQSGKG